MSESVKPEKTPTRELADQLLAAHSSGSDLSGFQSEINDMSNDERIRFTKELTSASFIGPQRADGVQTFVDGRVDQAGQLVDLELVSRDPSNPNLPSEASDLFTPGASGEKYDKHQELEEVVHPYQSLIQIMNERDRLVQSDRESVSAAGGSSSDSWDINLATVTQLMVKHNAGNPHLAQMKEMVKLGTVDFDTKSLYEPVDSVSSSLARGILGLDGAPDEVRRAYESVLADVRSMRQARPSDFNE